MVWVDAQSVSSCGCSDALQPRQGPWLNAGGTLFGCLVEDLLS